MSTPNDYAAATTSHVRDDVWRSALESFLVEIPNDPGINFRSVVMALDAVHGRTSGQVSSRGFLLTRHSLLDGRAPIDVLPEPDGPDRIWRLVNAVAAGY